MAETSNDTPTADVETIPQASLAADSNIPSTMPRPPPSAGASLAPSPPPPGSSASVPESVSSSVVTATPTLGGSTQTQVNVVNREFTPRPSTSDKSQHQFYANIPTKRQGTGTTENDNESIISRSTAQRTNMSATGGRRPPSRSHVPAIMPAYSFYHPLRPPAVANASGQQEIAQTAKSIEDQLKSAENQAKATEELRPTTSQRSEEFSSVHGKPSTEPLIPPPTTVKSEINQLHPVAEASSTSNRTSMHSAHLLRTTPPAQNPPAQPKNGVNHTTTSTATTRNWQHFPGKTHYHLGGRVQFGTQYLPNIGTGVLILIPAGLYFAFTYLLSQWCIDLPVADISGQNLRLASRFRSHT